MAACCLWLQLRASCVNQPLLICFIHPFLSSSFPPVLLLKRSSKTYLWSGHFVHDTPVCKKLKRGKKKDKTGVRCYMLDRGERGSKVCWGRERKREEGGGAEEGCGVQETTGMCKMAGGWPWREDRENMGVWRSRGAETYWRESRGRIQVCMEVERNPKSLPSNSLLSVELGSEDVYRQIQNKGSWNRTNPQTSTIQTWLS